MRKHLGATALALLLPFTMRAQADTLRSGTVFGTVYDSVARTVVVGALVQVVSASNPARDVYGATSDDRGRYMIASVKPDRYVVGFQHAALDSLSLELAFGAIVIGPGERVRRDLAVPSPRTIVQAVCGARVVADSAGLLMGALRDAGTGYPLDRGMVEARWHEIRLDSVGLTQLDTAVTAAVNTVGWFALCGVPGGVDVTLLAWDSADSTGLSLASLPAAGLVRRDLFIRGIATVQGSVSSEQGLPIPNSHVSLAGRGRSAVTDSTGGFQLSLVPAGTQTLEVRAIGYAPEYRLLHLAAGGDTTLAVALTSMKKVLDTIRVSARRLYDRELQDFERRRRFGSGTFFDAETIRRSHAHDLSQLLWRVPSVRVVQQGFDRTVVMRGATGPCRPEIFLNGMRIPSDMAGSLDLLARPAEVAGMEVYRGGEVPVQFASPTGCGAIVVWTRPPLEPRR